LDIRALRKQKGLTLKELSQKSKVSFVYISELERGEKKNPSARILCRIANALDVPLKKLIDEDFLKNE